jgi:hypothetical protein
MNDDKPVGEVESRPTENCSNATRALGASSKGGTAQPRGVFQPRSGPFSLAGRAATGKVRESRLNYARSPGAWLAWSHIIASGVTSVLHQGGGRDDTARFESLCCRRLGNSWSHDQC